MFGYSWSEWFAFFYLYSFCGWCFESTYVSAHEGHPVNRGFLRGPVIPLYGSGGIMMLLISAVFPGQFVTMFFMGMICATILEYVTGVTMEHIFKIRYWDYSDKKFNFQGYISLGSSVAWGVLTVIFTVIINRPIEHLILGIPEERLTVWVTLLTGAFGFDVITSVHAALNLAKALEAMTRARQELENLRVQLALMKADVKDASANRLGLMKESAAIRLAEVKALPELGLGYMKNVPARSFMKIADLKADIQDRFAALANGNAEKPEYVSIGQRIRDFRIPIPSPSRFLEHAEKAILKGNPGAISRRYAEALLELKEQILQKRDANGKETENENEMTCSGNSGTGKA